MNPIFVCINQYNVLILSIFFSQLFHRLSSLKTSVLKPRRALLSTFPSGQRQKWPVTSDPAVSFSFGAELLIALHLAGVKTARSRVNNDGRAAP